MADGALKLVVRAVIDEFIGAIDRVAQQTREVAGSVQESLFGMNEASKTSTSEMVASANQAADGTAAAWRRVAEASNEYKLAQREVRNASRDTTALAAGEEVALNRLAIAKERLAAASTELSAAQKATIVVNEEEAASFDLLGGAISRLVEAALLIGFINHVKESALEVEHLSSATGVSVVELTEWRNAMNVAGVATERLPQQLTKLAKTMEQASQGNKTAQHEFHQLGIETDGWAEKLPKVTDVLLQMSHHLHDGSASTREFAIASALLGKNAFETVAFLRQGDEAILKQLASQEANARATDRSVESAKNLQATWAGMSLSVQASLVPAFEVLVEVVQTTVAGFIKWKALLEATAVASQHLALSIIANFSGVGQVVDAAIHGHFDQIPAIARSAMDRVTNEIRTAALEWGNAYQRGDKAADAVFQHITVESIKGNAEVIGDAEKTSNKKEKIARDWLAKDNELLQKELDQHLKSQDKISEGELAIIIRENEEKIKENNKVLADSMDSANAMLDDARAAAQGKLEIEKAELDFEVQLGKISNAQKYQQLKKYEADAYAAERQALLLKQSLYAQDEKEFARIGRQIQKLDDDFTKHEIENARKATLAKTQSFQQFFRQIDQNIKTSINGWLQGTQTFSQAMQKLWQDIALAIIEQMEQIAINWLVKHVFMRAVSAIFHLDEEKDATAAATKKIAQEAITSKAVILFDSDVAAANAYAAYAEWPPVAAAMAAEAKATVLSFAAFEKGGIVPSTGLAMVHKNERIIPEDISRRIISGAQAPSGGNSGHIININYSVHAVDASSFADTMHRHADILGNVIMRRLRKKGFAMA